MPDQQYSLEQIVAALRELSETTKSGQQEKRREKKEVSPKKLKKDRGIIERAGIKTKAAALAPIEGAGASAVNALKEYISGVFGTTLSQIHAKPLESTEQWVAQEAKYGDVQVDDVKAFHARQVEIGRRTDMGLRAARKVGGYAPGIVDDAIHLSAEVVDEALMGSKNWINRQAAIQFNYKLHGE